MKPLVTVVMAVYNGGKYLKCALESLLSQTYFPIEIVLINDGSLDDTEKVAQYYPSQIHYLYQTNRGQPAAQNEGIFRAKGSYITFLDADDLHMPDKTALQVKFLEANPQFDFVFGHVEQFFSPELSLGIKKKWVCPSGTAPGYLAAAGLFRRECFERVGVFNEDQRIGVFVEWYMRAMEKELKYGLMPHKVLQRRIHENNMGIHFQNSRLEYIKIIKAALQRRLPV